MEYEAKYITDDIKLSCYDDRFFKSDIMFDHHMLIWFISGETKIVQADATYFFKKGDIFLIPGNQLATIINYPKDGQPHKTVVMHLSTTPQRWLTQKRLELAHYQFVEKKKKPVEVCYEVGFENLSHFSYAFKKYFGYAPTELTGKEARSYHP